MHICLDTYMYVTKLFLMTAKYAISFHVGKHERKYTYPKPQKRIQVCSWLFLFETNLIDFPETYALKD